jgi:Ca-activated chloride channel homolog
MKLRLYALSFVVLGLLTALSVRAGETSRTGNLAGCLTDASTGLPVVNARVVILETNQGANTDSSGCFNIIDVVPGAYHLSVVHPELGTFKGLPELDVTVTAGKASHLSLSLNAKGKKQAVKASEVPNEAPRGGQDAFGLLDLQKTISMSPTYDASGGGESFTRERKDESRYGFESSPKCAPIPGYQPERDNRTPEDMFFRDYGTNGFVDPRRDRLSTFALDVDDASYNIVQHYLTDGQTPPQDAVRVEEFINHFDYGYNTPADETFRVFTEITTSPFERDQYLLKVAVKGREIEFSERRPLNITFVIDVSGSMAREDRFDLVRTSIKTLVGQLDVDDRVGMVAYGSEAFEVLYPVSGDQTGEIFEAVDRLRVGGSTYAEAGIRLGYEMANRQYVNGHNNVILLCSDGVANVGETSPEAIMEEVQRFARRGITLSTFGYGMGNYNDVLLEQLATKGNGRYAYINTNDDIQTALVADFVGNLQVLARDVKVQVTFNPSVIAAYRLLGYENRAVPDQKFRDNRQDGGEVGAGHEVTALYELKLNRGIREKSLATVVVRWKNSEGTEVFELSRDARMDEHYTSFDRVRPEMRLAVVAGRFAELLKGTPYAENTTYHSLYRLAEPLRHDLPGEQTDNLLDMIRRAGDLSSEHANRRDNDDYYGTNNYKR